MMIIKSCQTWWKLWWWLYNHARHDDDGSAESLIILSELFEVLDIKASVGKGQDTKAGIITFLW